MTHPTIEAVVFDLDGLMLNTEDVFSESGKQLLARRGLEMTAEIHGAMLGRRPNEAFQAMKDLTGIQDNIETLKAETRMLFQVIAAGHLALQPGLTALINRIDIAKLPRAVATSSPRDYMIDMLSRFNLLKGFHVTLTAEDVTQGKPHPEIYKTAAERLGVAPANMLVLEDSEAGTRAAAAAGAYAVSIPNEHTRAGDFSMASLIAKQLDDAAIMRLIPADGR